MKLLTLLRHAQEVIQEVYGDGPIVGQIFPAVYYKEHVEFTLTV